MAEKKLQDLPPSYTNLGYDDESIAGPSAPKIQEDFVGDLPGLHQTSPTAPFPEEPPGPTPLAYNPPTLVFEEIYEACRHYVKRHCCYGSRFINRMKLTEISNKGVFHYILESFVEKRESAFRFTSYRGGPVDGPENGTPPRPWDMRVTPSQMFVDGTTERVIPHTEEVKICSKCDGVGTVRCGSCYGSGTESCWSCSGRGRDSEDRTCSSCFGSGRRTCSSCSGNGRVTCSRCDGYGKIKEFMKLIVTWKNHTIDYITQTGDLPQDKIRKAQAIMMLSDQKPQLQPIINAPEESVNAASARLLTAHQNSFPNELIIRQRHALRVIPFTSVKYQWKEKEGEFYVYDIDRKVYFEHYPQRCCCCTCC